MPIIISCTHIPHMYVCLRIPCVRMTYIRTYSIITVLTYTIFQQDAVVDVRHDHHHHHHHHRGGFGRPGDPRPQGYEAGEGAGEEMAVFCSFIFFDF